MLNVKEYISSGMLELYATGALTEAEMAEVENLAKQHPEIQAELERILSTLDRYAELHAVAPPTHLKDKVLNSVFLHTSADETEKQVFLNERKPEDGAKIISMPLAESQASSNIFKWLVAASVVLLVISNMLSIYFYNNWKQSEQRLQLAMVSQQQLAQNFEQVQQRLSQNQKTLAFLSDSRTKRIILNGLEKSPDAEVTVYWHDETKDTYLEVNSLPEAPDGYQYQLWALADGKPVDAGMLSDSVNISDFQQMKEVQEAQAFAITLEPKGGSIDPTMDQMFVMGKI